jgi:mannitol-1-/sugar-/sorbitol-6-phosphatase
MLRCILFDHDGTLVDTHPYHWQKYVSVLQAQGMVVDPAWRAEFVPKNGIQVWEFLRGHGLTLSQADFLAACDTWFKGHLHELKPRAGIIPVLDWVKSQHIPMAVVSNGRAVSVLPALDATGLRDYFVGVITAEDVTHKKPHPEAYLKGMDLIRDLAGLNDLRPDECLVIEDAESGVASARAAGAHVIYWQAGSGIDLLADVQRFLK